jgi:hypothetical protein
LKSRRQSEESEGIKNEERGADADGRKKWRQKEEAAGQRKKKKKKKNNKIPTRGQVLPVTRVS